MSVLVVGWWQQARLWWRARSAEQKLQQLAIGINSVVDPTQDEHLVMLDYDTKDLGKVRRSVKELQEQWRLADAHIYRTRHGHHAIFWYDHVPYERVKMIVNYARSVDPMFKYISRYYDHKTLRVAGKYSKSDVVFDRMLPGRRKPTRREWQLGEMRRREHAAFIGGG